MKKAEARRLQIGDNVFVYNGRYRQNAIVDGLATDARGIIWIGYKWLPPHGKKYYEGRKRYNSVYLPEIATTTERPHNKPVPLPSFMRNILKFADYMSKTQK